MCFNTAFEPLSAQQAAGSRLLQFNGKKQLSKQIVYCQIVIFCGNLRRAEPIQPGELKNPVQYSQFGTVIFRAWPDLHSST
jgi:hypothetical protein